MKKIFELLLMLHTGAALIAYSIWLVIMVTGLWTIPAFVSAILAFAMGAASVFVAFSKDTKD